MKLLQRKYLTEIRRKNNNFTDMKWNHTSNDNNELVVPIRVADTMPIQTNFTKKFVVKKMVLILILISSLISSLMLSLS